MGEAWVTLVRFSTVHEGEIARGMLEAAGIEAVLLDGGMASIAWHLAPAIGGVRLQVRPEDREAALAVLAGEDPDGPEEGPRLRVLEGGAAAPEPDGGEADEEACHLARRALGAALVGIFVPVVAHLYSAWLLARIAHGRGTLDRRSRAWAAMALGIDALALVPALLYLGSRLP